MFSLLMLVVGVLVGWNLPQPQFAKDAQAWVVAKVKGTPAV